MIYHRFDTTVDDPNNYYPSEFLNKLTPKDYPPHFLKLKVRRPIMLLRNIDLLTDFAMVHVWWFVVSKKAVLMLKLSLASMLECDSYTMCPSDDEMFPFHFKRKQIPIRLSFAMTVNKSQG
jgi:ATP-dependent DNA helicase PIF1